MKLSLEKQNIVTLSNQELNNIHGGGEKRSDRRTGNCVFSRKWGTTGTVNDEGKWEVTGCMKATPAKDRFKSKAIL